MLGQHQQHNQHFHHVCLSNRFFVTIKYRIIINGSNNDETGNEIRVAYNWNSICRRLDTDIRIDLASPHAHGMGLFVMIGRKRKKKGQGGLSLSSTRQHP